MNGLHLSLLAQADSGNSVLWTFLIYMVGVFVIAGLSTVQASVQLSSQMKKHVES